MKADTTTTTTKKLNKSCKNAMIVYARQNYSLKYTFISVLLKICNFSFKINLNKKTLRAGEVAQWLRALPWQPWRLELRPPHKPSVPAEAPSPSEDHWVLQDSSVAETQALVRGSPRFKEEVKSDSRGMHTHSHMYIRSHRHTNKGMNECIYLKRCWKGWP